MNLFNKKSLVIYFTHTGENYMSDGIRNIEKGNTEIIAVGDFYQFGEEVLKELKANHDVVITLEDGILQGGFGEKIASFYGDSDINVKNYGIEKAFYDRYDVNELLKENRITKEQIIEDIEKMI